jgi:hypothetical protein
MDDRTPSHLHHLVSVPYIVDDGGPASSAGRLSGNVIACPLEGVRVARRHREA